VREYATAENVSEGMLNYLPSAFSFCPKVLREPRNPCCHADADLLVGCLSPLYVFSSAPTASNYANAHLLLRWDVCRFAPAILYKLANRSCIPLSNDCVVCRICCTWTCGSRHPPQPGSAKGISSEGLSKVLSVGSSSCSVE